MRRPGKGKQRRCDAEGKLPAAVEIYSAKSKGFLSTSREIYKTKIVASLEEIAWVGSVTACPRLYDISALTQEAPISVETGDREKGCSPSSLIRHGILVHRINKSCLVAAFKKKPTQKKRDGLTPAGGARFPLQLTSFPLLRYMCCARVY